MSPLSLSMSSQMLKLELKTGMRSRSFVELFEPGLQMSLTRPKKTRKNLNKTGLDLFYGLCRVGEFEVCNISL